MITRDSRLWTVLLISAVVTAISSRLDLLDALIPENYHRQAHAAIELSALIIGVVAGVLRMSPLPISPEGRVKAIRKTAVRAAGERGKADAAVIKAKEIAAEKTAESVAAGEAADNVRESTGWPT